MKSESENNARKKRKRTLAKTRERERNRKAESKLNASVQLGWYRHRTDANDWIPYTAYVYHHTPYSSATKNSIMLQSICTQSNFLCVHTIISFIYHIKLLQSHWINRDRCQFAHLYKLIDSNRTRARTTTIYTLYTASF